MRKKPCKTAETMETSTNRISEKLDISQHPFLHCRVLGIPSTVMSTGDAFIAIPLTPSPSRGLDG
jgi:hypothetical protein